MKKKVVVIILNWNGANLLKENISSIVNQDFKNFCVLIVDNGSTDNSKDFIQSLCKRYSKIKSLFLNKNYGYVGGNNLGIQFAIKNFNPEFIAILNSDVKVEKNWLSRLLNGFNKKEIGICTSNIFLYYPFHKIILQSKKDQLISNIQISNLKYHVLQFENESYDQGQLLNFPFQVKKNTKYFLAVPTNKKKFGEITIDHDNIPIEIISNGKSFQYDKSNLKIKLSPQLVHQNSGSKFNDKKLFFEEINLFKFKKNLKNRLVDAGCGAAFAIRTNLFKKFGLFQKNYFMYFEDSEFSYRIRQHGFKIMFVNDAICYHRFWGSSGNTITKTQTYFGTRNRLLFIKKYFGFKKFAYFWTRTAARTLIWAFEMLKFKKNAKMYFTCYLKALFSSIFIN